VRYRLTDEYYADFSGFSGRSGGAIAVRNSRHPSGPALIYTRAEITAFLTGVKNGEFDDLLPASR
jgi:hypothetical protein